MISISIIIPIYNVELYVKRCLESVMAQECSNVEIECILVDDNSLDNSMLIAERLIDKYVGKIKFVIIRHERNLGLSVARNTGMKYATGEFLMFVDSDDYITVDCIEKLTDPIKINPDLEVVKGNHIGRAAFKTSAIPTVPINNDQLLNLLYMSIIHVMVWNTLIKRSLVLKWQLSFKSGLLYEDTLWSVQLFRHVNIFQFVHDITYYYEDITATSQTGILQFGNRTKALSYTIYNVKELLRTFDDRHTVPYTLFIASKIMRMVDFISKEKQLDREIIRTVLQLRKQIMKYTLCHFRLILAIFLLVLFPPFQMLTRFRWFRHRYYLLVKLTCKIAMLFDFLHR